MKKKYSSNDIWMILMAIIPGMLLGFGMAELQADNFSGMIYKALFWGLGTMVGITGYFFTKDKSVGIKVFTLVGLIGLSSIPFFFERQLTDDEILQQDWITQTIGDIEFDTPSKLPLVIDEVPKGLTAMYDVFESYNDGGKDRFTVGMKTVVKTDSVPIKHSFDASLIGMLKNIKVKLVELSIDTLAYEASEITIMISFPLKGRSMHGYGYMCKNGNSLTSLWLMPRTRSFSKSYIEEFDAGIFPNF